MRDEAEWKKNPRATQLRGGRDALHFAFIASVGRKFLAACSHLFGAIHILFRCSPIAYSGKAEMCARELPSIRHTRAHVTIPLNLKLRTSFVHSKSFAEKMLYFNFDPKRLCSKPLFRMRTLANSAHTKIDAQLNILTD